MSAVVVPISELLRYRRTTEPAWAVPDICGVALFELIIGEPLMKGAGGRVVSTVTTSPAL